jgi:hypothetical protein
VFRINFTLQIGHRFIDLGDTTGFVIVDVDRLSATETDKTSIQVKPSQRFLKMFGTTRAIEIQK